MQIVLRKALVFAPLFGMAQFTQGITVQIKNFHRFNIPSLIINLSILSAYPGLPEAEQSGFKTNFPQHTNS